MPPSLSALHCQCPTPPWVQGTGGVGPSFADLCSPVIGRQDPLWSGEGGSLIGCCFLFSSFLSLSPHSCSPLTKVKFFFFLMNSNLQIELGAKLGTLGI